MMPKVSNPTVSSMGRKEAILCRKDGGGHHRQAWFTWQLATQVLPKHPCPKTTIPYPRGSQPNVHNSRTKEALQLVPKSQLTGKPNKYQKHHKWSQAYLCMPVIPGFGMWTQEDQKFKASIQKVPSQPDYRRSHLTMIKFKHHRGRETQIQQSDTNPFPLILLPGMIQMKEFVLIHFSPWLNPYLCDLIYQGYRKACLTSKSNVKFYN